jgi:hypothetical protein
MREMEEREEVGGRGIVRGLGVVVRKRMVERGGVGEEGKKVGAERKGDGGGWGGNSLLQGFVIIE